LWQWLKTGLDTGTGQSLVCSKVHAGAENKVLRSSDQNLPGTQLVLPVYDSYCVTDTCKGFVPEFRFVEGSGDDSVLILSPPIFLF